jgi:AcrR family transcriptional regulator
MRQRLIDAAITVLGRVGYAAVTTQLVMNEAGVSRGAMLHHFPTKIDLIVAVAEYASETQNRFVRHSLAGIEKGMTLYLAVTEATWEAICQPPGLALIEIIMASRSDPALGERLPQVVEEFQSRQAADVWAVAHDLGMRDRDAVERMVRLHRAAMRGLVIEMMFSGEQGPADQAMELLSWYKRLLTGSLLTNEKLDLNP